MAAVASDDVDMREEELEDLSNPKVVDKYRDAGKVVNTVLQGLVAQLVPGRLVHDVCAWADKELNTHIESLYKKDKNPKSVAFPTCISVNERIAHYSPSKAESTTLAAGDCVKIDMGVHFDGFIAVGAHTHVIADPAAPVTGRRADVIAAAYAAAEVALRTIKPGVKNTAVTEAVRAVADAYAVTPLQGVLMHNMPRFVIDGQNVTLLRGDDPDIRVDEFEYALHEVYTLDIVFSTGEGKPREAETRVQVYKHAAENLYSLKMKASRALVAEVAEKFTTMPFTLRALEMEESHVRMGVTECLKHGVLVPYPVLEEKPGAEVAHVKFTVALLPGGALKLAGLALPANVCSDKTLPAPLLELLVTAPYQNKKDKKREKKAAAATAAGATPDEEMKDA